MKTYGDHRGVALIFEDEKELDQAIDRLTRIRNGKAEDKTPYPAIYIYTDQRMPNEDAKELHDQVWFMHYTTMNAPPKNTTTAPRNDN